MSEDNLELATELAKFIAIQSFSSGPDMSKRPDLKQMMEKVEPLPGHMCMAMGILGFLSLSDRRQPIHKALAPHLGLIIGTERRNVDNLCSHCKKEIE